MFGAIYFLFIISKGANAGGHAAHLAGMAAGAFYVMYPSWKMKFKHKSSAVNMEKKFQSEIQLKQKVDQILEKVHTSGIASLTNKEKKILKKATQSEQHHKNFF